jgi:hypothetical protein
MSQLGLYKLGNNAEDLIIAYKLGNNAEDLIIA